MTPPTVNVYGAMDRLKVSKRTIYNMLYDGRLTGRIGQWRPRSTVGARITVASIDALLASWTRQGKRLAADGRRLSA